MQKVKEEPPSVSFKGTPLSLIGNFPKLGQIAPDAKVTDANLNYISLSSAMNKPCILLSVPSLDTEVCDREAHRFNEKVNQFGDKVSLLTVSMDLPFAQKRWCGKEDLKNVQTFSDYREASFGKNYGVLIKELHLLARAVFLIDKTKTIRYLTLIKEVTEEPNYEQVLEELKKIL